MKNIIRTHFFTNAIGLFLGLFPSSPLFSHSIPMLYEKNLKDPSTQYENFLASHTKNSLENATKLQSKLTDIYFSEADSSIKWRNSVLPLFHSLSEIKEIEYYHLLNNICNLAGASHLHVGLLTGDSYIAALFGNQFELNQQIGIDWFMECPEKIFIENCNLHLNSDKFQIVNSGCFDVKKTIFSKPIDIYFYDADHSLLGHQSALSYYNDIFADVFVVIIDDWNCPWIRIATFKAFSELKYGILYENIIHSKKIKSEQYIAVIRK